MAEHKNIIKLLIESDARHPDRLAFVNINSSVTYRKLLYEIRIQSAYYMAKGLTKGSKVLVMLPVGIELYKTVLSLLYIGACPVFLDEWVSVKRLTECCRLVECDAMVADQKILFYSYFIKELKKIRVKLKAGITKHYPGENDFCEVSTEDTALITFTTGSTGLPKAANRTHGYLYEQYEALKPLLENDAVTSLVTLPIVILLNLALGKTIILPPAKVNKPESVPIFLNVITQFQPEEIITSPAVLSDLADSTNYKTDDIKYILSGGGPIFPDLAKKVRNVFVKAKCTAVYGSTEAEPISIIDFDTLAVTETSEIIAKGLPVGKVDKHVQIGVIPVDTNAIPALNSIGEFRAMLVPRETIGEIVVSGPHVLCEYTNNAAATERYKIKAGNDVWHRTGDVGNIDNNGNLYLRGTISSIFEYAGKTYYPLVAEYVFKQLTGLSIAIMASNNNALLIVEGVNDQTDETFDSVAELLSLENFHIQYVRQIPKDVRHRTKTDYDKLREIVNTIMQ